MKRIKAELLDQLLYVDRAHTKPLYNSEGETDHTVRSYLKVIMDLPIQERKLTPSVLKSVDNIVEALESGDLKLEDADFKAMAKQIEDVGLKSPIVYKQYNDLVESAEDYKPS